MGSSAQSDKSLKAIDDLLAKGEMKHGRRRIRKAQILPSPSVSAGITPARKRGSSSNVEVIRVPGWSARSSDLRANSRAACVEWLVHGFSTRTGGTSTVYRPQADAGDLNLTFTAHDDPKRVAANRRLFLHAVCGETFFPELITLKQIHSSLIRRVQSTGSWPEASGSLSRNQVKDQGKGQGQDQGRNRILGQGDGLMTDEPGLLLGIQTADCVPLLLADRKNRAVAAFHAGWRGTLARIAENGVGRMRLEFGSRPEDMIAAIGPGIGPCCYSVGEEVLHEFESQFSYARDLFSEVYDSDPIKEKYPMLFLTARAPGHSDLGPYLHLDLVEANRRQLLAAGLKPRAIQVMRECTSCDTDRFFSHRRERGFTGRMMSVIGLA